MTVMKSPPNSLRFDSKIPSRFLVTFPKFLKKWYAIISVSLIVSARFSKAYVFS